MELVVIKNNLDGMSDRDVKNTLIGTKKNEIPASRYSVFFDSDSPRWVNDAILNEYMVRNIERYSNAKLRAQRFVLLNDVYHYLGISKSEIGGLVGWIYDEENPIGDNYIEIEQTVYNKEKNILLLDFNVDGYILDRI